jgi:hypothetical protein
MQITYTLSSRQQKELLIRGQDLLLALPHPPVEVRDPVDWARSVLPQDLREYVVAAEPGTVVVQPPHSRKVRADSIDACLGNINPSNDSPRWLVSHAIILATLRFSTPRGKTPIQWPANVRMDGVPLFSSQESP